MTTPNWHSVAQGQTFSATDVNQLLGTHAITYINQGATQVSYLTTAGSGSAGNNNSGAQWLAQPFTTGASQTKITRIELYLQASAATGVDTTIEIRTDSSGAPSNTSIYSVLLPADFQPPTTSPAWI